MTFKIRIHILTLCLIALGGNTPAYSTPQQSIESFQRQVKKRFNKDQAARIAMEKISNKQKPLNSKDHARHQRLAQRAIDIDASNTKWLKSHISKFELPTPSMIGADTSERMFILLIHADRDRKFQKQCVKLMEASPTDWPARYPERLKTRLSFTKPLKLKQTDELKQPKPRQKESPTKNDSSPGPPE